MAHAHTQECEDLKAARDALRASLRPSMPRYSQDLPVEPYEVEVGAAEDTAGVEQELAAIEAAFREAGCQYAER